MKIPLVEQQHFTVFHLYQTPIHDNRTEFQHLLTFSQIGRNDDSLFYFPIKHSSACKQLGQRQKLCAKLYFYLIDSIAICEAQLLKKFQNVPENFQRSVVISEGYSVHQLETNRWLLTVSEPLHVLINCVDF